MHRVRAGLTGLGIVFLFTLVASVVFAPSQQSQPSKVPGEPLAKLGVAPSSDKGGQPAEAPAALPAGASPMTEKPTAAVPDAALSALERGEAEPAI